MTNLQQLYTSLFKAKLLNINFDKFAQYFESEKYRRQVYDVVSKKKMFTKSFESFDKAFSLPDVEAPETKVGVDKDGNDIMIGGKVSQEKNTWLEDSFGKNSVTDLFGDMYRAGKQGWAAGRSVDEALEVYKKGRDLSDQDLQAFLDANKRMREAGVSDEMLEYNRIAEEEGGGIFGVLKAFANNPTIMPQVIVSSFSQMLGSAVDSEEVLGTAAASSGAGAAAGAAIGSTGFSLGPLGALTTAGGAVSGAVGGFFGGLTGVMETGNTLAQLLQEEIGEDVEMTKENVRAVLEDPDRFESLKNKAVARGLTIGAIEGITAGLSRGVGASMVSGAGKKALTATAKKRLATGVALGEMTAGAGGEFLGQKAAGQDTDLSEIFLEGIAEAKGIANVADILTKKSYTMNGGAATRKDIENFFNDPNVSDKEKAEADIDIRGDKSLQSFVDQVRSKAYIKTQIDPRVQDESVRDQLVELEIERQKAESNSKKKGAFAVPGAKKKLENIESQIADLVGRYEGVEQTDTDVEARAKAAKDVRVEVGRQRAEKIKEGVKKQKAYSDLDIQIEQGNADKASETFRESNALNIQYRKAVLQAELEAATDPKRKKKIQDLIDQENKQEASLEQDAQEAKNAHGFLLEDESTGKLKIVINEDVAFDDQNGNINVAAHEFLHAVLRKTFYKKSDVADVSVRAGKGVQTGSKLLEFLLQDESSKNLLGEILPRLKSYENTNQDIKFEEVLNLLSDGFADIGYNNANEGYFSALGSRISDVLRAYLPASINSKLKFGSGKQVFDFVRTFNKAIAGDKVAGRIISRATREGIEVETRQDVETEAEVRGETAQSRAVSEEVSKAQATVDKIAVKPDGTKMNKAEWDTEGAVEAYTTLIANNGIDGVIKGQLLRNDVDVSAVDANVNGVPLDEFIERVKEKLIPEILGFDPGVEVDQTGKFGFSGYLNQRVAFRVGDISKKAKKEVSSTSLDNNLSEEGKSTFADHVAAEQDSRLTAFEEQDQSVPSAMHDEDPTYVRSEFRRKLVNKKGEIFLDEESVEGVRQGIRDIVSNLKEPISSKNFMQKLEDEIKKKMKNLVQGKISARADFARFLADNIETIVEYSTVQDLTALERKLPKGFPDGRKIFTVLVKKNISPSEVDKAIAQGKIKADVGRTTGPPLYEKRVPTPEEIEAFFFGRTSTGKTQLEVLGYQVAGRSTLGTRKDGMARMIISVLGLDAIMETVQEADTMRDAQIFSPNLDIDLQVKELAGKTHRGTNYLFSRGFSAQQENQIADLKKLMFNEGRTAESVQAYVRNNNVERKVLKKAFEGHLKRRADKIQGVFKLEGVAERFNDLRRSTGDKNHKILERLVINALTDAVFEQKLDKEIAILLAAPMEGFMPDAYIGVTVGETFNDIGIEVKGQISRSPSKSVDIEITNGKLQNLDAINKDLVDSIGEENAAVITSFIEDKIAPLLVKNGFNNFNTKTNLTPSEWSALKATGITAEIANLVEMIDLSYVQRMYEAKEIPSQYINIGTKGVFHLREDILNVGTKPFTFDGDQRLIPFSARLSWSGSNTKNTSGKLSIRFDAEINEDLFDKQDINLLEKKGADKFISNSQLSRPKASKRIQNQETINEAFNKARTTTESTPVKGISIFDFDETVGISENFVIAKKGKETKRIASDEWPFVGERLAAEGWAFDFSDFNKVTRGKPGPLMQKLKNQIKKYGAKDVYILTARAPQSQKAIHDWLKTQGINLPYKNITGLGNSTGEAKAMWILDKYANEGYNDIYFVDDAMPNVDAVKNILDQLDVKGKSVQARIQFSKGRKAKFNKMIEQNKGVEASRIFSEKEAAKLGKKRGIFNRRFFVPPSADDFVGLLRYFIGKGKKGEADMAFFKKALLDPFARAYREMNMAKMAIMNDFKQLRKQSPEVVKKLGKLIPGTVYTYDNAIRVYLFDSAGFDIPGLSDAEVIQLSQIVIGDPELMAFASNLGKISRAKEGYLEPSETWDVENIAMDMQNAVDRIGREKYLKEWNENVAEIFDKDNLNKIEAVYGTDVREALEDMLYAMKTGRNRPVGNNRISNQFMNWINNSIGAIMFFNMRSAVLQMISVVNFLNFEENNIFAAAKMFANQKQYWKDFSFLFNSDFLQARRAGLSTNVNEAELANAVAGAKNKALAALRYLLKLGFTPTQIADSFAIASGGATYYRGRVNKYTKEGLSEAEAKKKAFLDFQEIAEETQQSSRPDRISMQQRSLIGRLILAFANTPMQMARLTKKAAQDLIAGRGDWRSNVSRILYYGAVQNIIFAGLQNAIFALAFDDEELETDEDYEKAKEKQENKTERIFNGALDSLLRGSGIYGAVVATLKNTIKKFAEERGKDWKADYGNVVVELLNLSPSIGSKFRKIYSAMKNDKYNKNIYDRMGYDTLDNPIYQTITLGVEGTTNIPINRMLRKVDNIKASFDEKNSAMQRIFVALGWDQWSLGIDTYEEVDKAREELKQEKKEQKEKEKTNKQEALENKFEQDQRRERKQGKKNITCSAVTSTGVRCKRKPVKGGKCTIHEKVETINKKRQCKRRKADGTRCKMMTNSKSQLCYYHD